jgi:hypothetical protein
MKRNYDFSKGQRGAVIHHNRLTAHAAELIAKSRTITFSLADHDEVNTIAEARLDL